MLTLSKISSTVRKKLRFNRDLIDLARKSGTDKLEHGYISYYKDHFDDLRDKSLNILEIGIANGASLGMWQAYFPASQIHALDIRDKHAYESDRVRIYQGDQNDVGFLRSVAEQAGAFDIIIDDGSHFSEHVITSFTTLFPCLKADGIYVIEDLHTAYWHSYGGQWRDLNSGSTSMSFIKNLLDGLNCHWIPGRSSEHFDQHIHAIHSYPKIVFIYKGDNPVVHRPYELKMMEQSLNA